MIKLRIFFFLLLAIGHATNVAYSQEVSTDTTRAPLISLHKPRFTPFIAPTFAPETSLMFVGGGLFTFRIKPDNPLIQRSVIPFSAGYSINKSLLVNIRPMIDGINNIFRVAGDIWVRNMPDNYWGVGYENGRTVERSDSTTLYQRNWWQVRLNLTARFMKVWYGGIAIDLNATRVDDPNPLMQSDPDYLEFGPSNQNTGMGLVFQYDSRDLAVNAYKGRFVSLSSIYYGRFLGGENEYLAIEGDYRGYEPVKREGRTITWQVRTRYTTGEVPYGEMSMLGTPFDLRGYRWGHYRDKTILFGLVEYRHMFMRKTPRKDGSFLSRHGVVAWAGGGSLANNYSELVNWLPNAGIGYRFEVQDRLNLRIDYGFGNGSSGLYVNFNESF